jgi:hypothetical protein
MRRLTLKPFSYEKFIAQNGKDNPVEIDKGLEKNNFLLF